MTSFVSYLPCKVYTYNGDHSTRNLIINKKNINFLQFFIYVMTMYVYSELYIYMYLSSKVNSCPERFVGNWFNSRKDDSCDSFK